MSIRNINLNSQKLFLREINNIDLEEFICRFMDKSFIISIKTNLQISHPTGIYNQVRMKTKFEESMQYPNDIYLLIEYFIQKQCVGHMTFHLVRNCDNISSIGPMHVKNNRHNPSDICQRIRIEYIKSDTCNIKYPIMSLSSLKYPSRPLYTDVHDFSEATLFIINKWFEYGHPDTIKHTNCSLSNINNQKLMKRIIQLRGHRARGGSKLTRKHKVFHNSKHGRTNKYRE